MIAFEDDHTLRRLAAALGVGTATFSILPALAPGTFARLFGLSTRGPAALAVVRSIGVRDAVAGMGLCSAALHGGKYAPWLLSRLLVDAADVVTTAVALGQSGGNRRLGALGLVALGAASVDAALWQAARHAARRERDDLAPLDY